MRPAKNILGSSPPSNFNYAVLMLSNTFKSYPKCEMSRAVSSIAITLSFNSLSFPSSTLLTYRVNARRSM